MSYLLCLRVYLHSVLQLKLLQEVIQCLPPRPTRRYPGWALLGVPSTNQPGLWEN